MLAAFCSAGGLATKCAGSQTRESFAMLSYTLSSARLQCIGSLLRNTERTCVENCCLHLVSSLLFAIETTKSAAQTSCYFPNGQESSLDTPRKARAVTEMTYALTTIYVCRRYVSSEWSSPTQHPDLITTDISGASSVALLTRIAFGPEYLSWKEDTGPEILNRLQYQPSVIRGVAQIPHKKVMDVTNTVRMVSPPQPQETK